MQQQHLRHFAVPRGRCPVQAYSLALGRQVVQTMRHERHSNTSFLLLVQRHFLRLGHVDVHLAPLEGIKADIAEGHLNADVDQHLPRLSPPRRRRAPAVSPPLQDAQFRRLCASSSPCTEDQTCGQRVPKRERHRRVQDVSGTHSVNSRNIGTVTQKDLHRGVAIWMVTCPMQGCLSIGIATVDLSIMLQKQLH